MTITAGQPGQSTITAASASLDGRLKVDGISTVIPVKSSLLEAGRLIILETTSGLISGEYDTVTITPSTVSGDYLSLAGYKSQDQKKYSVGLGLSWLAGGEVGHGTFTLTNASDTFEVDSALANQNPVSGTNWTGQDLTKKGLGNLILSAANSYSGATTIAAGTLTTGAVNAIASSTAVQVDQNAVLDLNNLNQTAQNLGGAGTIRLGSATHPNGQKYRRQRFLRPH